MRVRDPHWPSCYAVVMALLALGACTTPDKVALKDYAPKSPDADIEAVSLSASDHDKFDPSRVGTEFPDTTQQVAVWYKWKGADSGKKVGIRWSKDGTVVLEQGDTLVKVSGTSAYVLKMAAGSTLPIGNYQVELLENGMAVTKIPFKVGAGGAGGGDGAMTAAVSQGAGSASDASTPAPADSASAAAPEASGGPAGAAAAEPAAVDPSGEEAAGEEASAGATASETQPAVGQKTGGAVLATQETKWPGIVVEIVEFTRKGKTLTAKLRFTNRGAKEAHPSFYYSETYLLDADNKKVEVLKDDQGHYLGALTSGYSNRWSESLKPGTSQTVWMRFPATAGSALTLQVPGMDPFEDVRVQN